MPTNIRKLSTRDRADGAGASGRSVDLTPRAAAGGIRAVSIFARIGPWRDVLRRRLLALADAAGVGVTMAAVAAFGSLGTANALWSVLLIPAWLVLAKLFGLYDRDHRALRHLTTDELPSIVSWALLGTGMLAVGLSLTPETPPTETFIQIALGVALTASLARALARSLWRHITPPDNVIVVGSGPSAGAVARKLELFPDMHAQVTRVIDEHEIRGQIELWRSHPVGVSDNGNQPLEIERIVVANQGVDEQLIAELVAICRRDAIKLSVIPPARSIFGTAVRLNHVADLPLIEYNTWDISRSTRAIKRCVDVSLALVLLALLSPVLILAALLVRLGSPGPVLFVQMRAGQDGRRFRMYKFRTMVRDAEKHLPELIDLDRLETPMFKLAADPRVTRVGRHLRRWSLDEMPQLINVLRGDMSLVGPRPEQMELVERYSEEARKVRLALKPGITGPMQVFGRGALSFEERLSLEREYVENLSIGTDMRILLATVAVVARGAGAF